MIRRLTKRGAGDQSGQTLVEFSLTIVFVMFVVFFAFELMMYIYTYNVLADAAKEGVRYAVVHGASSSSPSGPSSGAKCTAPCSCSSSSANVATVQSVVKNYAKASGHDISALTVNVCYYDGSNAINNRVKIVVNYTYKTLLNLNFKPPTMNAAAEGRIVF